MILYGEYCFLGSGLEEVNFLPNIIFDCDEEMWANGDGSCHFVACKNLEKFTADCNELTFGMFWNCPNIKKAYITNNVSKISNSTFGTDGSEGMIVYGYTTSAAEEYCYKKSLKFIPVDTAEFSTITSSQSAKGKVGKPTRVTLSVAGFPETLKIESPSCPELTFAREDAEIVTNTSGEQWTVDLIPTAEITAFTVTADYGLADLCATDEVTIFAEKDNTPPVISAETVTPAVIGEFAKVSVKVNGSPLAIRFVDEDVTTINRENATVTDNGDNTETWVVNFPVIYEEQQLIVFAKYESGWNSMGTEFNFKNYVEICDHNWESVYFAATCLNDGYSCFKCSVCSEQKDFTIIPKLQHTYSDWEIETEATCSNEGLKVRNCTACLEARESEVIPPLAHVASKWEIVVEPSCTEKGVVAQKCRFCGVEIKRAVSEASGHITGGWTVITEATCSSNGLKVQKCITCSQVLESEIIPQTDHFASEWEFVVKPTCTENGIAVKNCVGCGVELDRKEVEKLEHVATDWIIEQSVSCGQPGLRVKKCVDCGEILNREEIPALEHTPTDWLLTIIPTCKSNGLMVKKCASCNLELGRVEIEAFDHLAGEWVTESEPACGHNGLKVQRCVNCREVLNSEEIPAPEHIPKEWEVISIADCDTKGVEVRCCSVCGEELERKETPAWGHLPEDWITEIEPTCSASGLQVQKCSVCGKDVNSKAIAKTDHTPGEFIVTKAPTCLNAGAGIQKCVVCSKSIAVQNIPALGHSFGEWTVISVPNVSKNGSKKHTCTVCNVTQAETIPALYFTPGDEVAIDYANSFISGISAGETSLDSYVRLANSNYSWIYENAEGSFGTGSKATLKYGETVLGEYTIILFGDVNGDGWYDGTDSIIVSCLANGMLSKDDVSPAFYEAADCNHDGVIDSFDVALLEQAGLLLANVDQSKSAEELTTDEAYIEYLDLIDQTPEEEIEDEVIETPEEQPEAESFNIFDFIVEIIKKFVDLILSRIPVPYK